MGIDNPNSWILEYLKHLPSHEDKRLAIANHLAKREEFFKTELGKVNSVRQKTANAHASHEADINQTLSEIAVELQEASYRKSSLSLEEVERLTEIEEKAKLEKIAVKAEFHEKRKQLESKIAATEARQKLFEVKGNQYQQDAKKAGMDYKKALDDYNETFVNGEFKLLHGAGYSMQALAEPGRTFQSIFDGATSEELCSMFSDVPDTIKSFVASFKLIKLFDAENSEPFLDQKFRSGGHQRILVSRQYETKDQLEEFLFAYIGKEKEVVESKKRRVDDDEDFFTFKKRRVDDDETADDSKPSAKAIQEMLQHATHEELTTIISDMADEDKDDKLASKIEEIFSPKRKR